MTSPQAAALRDSDDRTTAPMIPGAREPGIPATFGLHSVVILPNGPSTMDAATIAMHQKEGGGGPAQQRVTRQQLPWNLWVRKLRGFLTGW